MDEDFIVIVVDELSVKIMDVQKLLDSYPQSKSGILGALHSIKGLFGYFNSNFAYIRAMTHKLEDLLKMNNRFVIEYLHSFSNDLTVLCGRILEKKTFDIEQRDLFVSLKNDLQFNTDKQYIYNVHVSFNPKSTKKSARLFNLLSRLELHGDIVNIDPDFEKLEQYSQNKVTIRTLTTQSDYILKELISRIPEVVSYSIEEYKAKTVIERIKNDEVLPFNKIRDALLSTFGKSEFMDKEFSIQFINEDIVIPQSILSTLSDFLFILVQNAIVHGLEDQDVRDTLQKPKNGSIIIHTEIKHNILLVSVKDDGKGINPQKLWEKGVEMGLIDKFEDYDQQIALNILFVEGVSTRTKVDEQAGRGMGLFTIRKTLNRGKGKISVRTKLHEGTEFLLKIPLG